LHSQWQGIGAQPARVQVHLPVAAASKLMLTSKRDQTRVQVLLCGPGRGRAPGHGGLGQVRSLAGQVRFITRPKSTGECRGNSLVQYPGPCVPSEKKRSRARPALRPACRRLRTKVPNRSLWRTRAVGMVPVSDAPRRWSGCTVPPPADANACLPMPAPAYRSQHLPLLPSLSHPRRRVPSVRPAGNFRTRGTFRGSRTGSHPQRKYRPRRPER
jgi:hypothetical protein